MEEITKHTPGPWKVGPTNLGNEIFIQDHRDIGITLVFPRTDKPDPIKANARLIAAAPDLLAACESALVMWAGDDIKLETIRQAIAKARGTDDARALAEDFAEEERREGYDAEKEAEAEAARADHPLQGEEP
jgi:hypothetical protein